MKSKKVGKVTLEFLSENVKNDYLDSNWNKEDIEAQLLDFFNKPQTQKQQELIHKLEDTDSWALTYHLSPQREFILDWYPFKDGARVLEIGAGCGAITGSLCRRAEEVVANELSPARATVIANRFKDKENLKIVVGNAQEYKPKEKFDYVVVIGVLEYAGRYFAANDEDILIPYINFLKHIKTFLKKKGKLLLAIENRIGLKYVSGGMEDHTGEYFNSLNNYPQYDGVKTFTHKELSDLMQQSGFSKIEFMYPFPDYKMPETIFSSSDFMNMSNITSSSFAKVKDESNPKLEIYNEIIFADTLRDEKLLHTFANSFLVEARI